MNTRSTSSHRRVFTAILGVALIGATIAGGAVLLGRADDRATTHATTSPGPSPEQSDGQGEVFPPGQPCGGRRVPLAELASLKGPFWLPKTAFATGGGMISAWDCGAPTFVYPAGSIAFEPGWGTVPDPRRRWQEMADQWGHGSVGTALGRPAFLDEPADGFGGEICVIVGDTLVRAIGEPDVPLSELLDMVNSLDLDRPISK